jgi:alpha-glucosidase (family GH31 glycosyl hydrolase)
MGPPHLKSLVFSSSIAVLAAALFAASLASAQTHPLPAVTDPAANTAAVVIAGNARFTVLTPQLIRMEWAADGKFEDHASFVFLNRRRPVPHFAVNHLAGGRLSIQTSALTLVYSSGGAGKFDATNLNVTFRLNSKEVNWHPGMKDAGNLLGTARTLDRARGGDLQSPMEPGLISRDGWTIVDDSTRPLFDSADFSFAKGEQSTWPWVMLRPSGDRQDWYFFGYGHEYKQALADYVTVAGRIPLPPRFAFGSWWSRYWAYSDQELTNLVKDFRDNDVPLDVIVIDMDWHINRQQLEALHETDQSGHGLGWSGYTWNPLLFPDPDKFLQDLHSDGLKVTLNLHPASGVQPWETRYPKMAQAMGIDPSTHKYVPFNITDKKFATNYMDIMHHRLEHQGIDFWWLDWQQESNTSITGVNPTWWLNYVHFTDQEREGKRPLLFHRWGGLGNHRYQIGFSGDTISVWDSLAFQPWFTATAANVGYAYWSHDIGGHMPGKVDAELYTRWVQFGAFSPILRTHTTKNPDSERRIWAYPEPYADIMKNVFRLRYAFQPYLYTEARHTYDTGVAFLRPLYYNWPEADEAYTAKNEYQFGDQILVAPVTTPVDAASGLAQVGVWIPGGDWIEQATGKHFTGPISIKRNFSIDQIPIYVRAGAILPMQPPMRSTGAKPVDPLILNIFPLSDAASSSYTVYDDASTSEAYKRGVCAWTKVNAKQTGDDLEIEIEPTRGSYPGMLLTRGYEIRLPADWPVESVSVNNHLLARAAWHYEGNTLTSVISVPRSSVRQPVHIRVHRAAGSLARRTQLDGFPGAMTRLRSAYDALNASYPANWAPDPLIDAMQTGDRIAYHPKNATQEIARFRQVYNSTSALLLTLAQKPNREPPAAKPPASASQSGSSARQVAYRTLVNRALLLVQDASPAEK